MAENNTLTIGQTVFWYRNYGTLNRPLQSGEITSIGRRWAKVGNALRFDRHTLYSDIGGSGRVWLSKEEHDQEAAKTEELTRIKQYFSDYTAARSLSLNQLREIASIIWPECPRGGEP
jgi:hypothetical protein